jgi:hypothetical protein
LSVLINAVVIAVGGDGCSIETETQQPEDSKLTVLTSGAFCHLRAIINSLCILAWERPRRKLMLSEVSIHRLMNRSLYDVFYTKTNFGNVTEIKCL